MALVCELNFFSGSSFLISQMNNLLSSPPEANLLSSRDHFIPHISLLCPTYFKIGFDLLLKSIVFSKISHEFITTHGFKNNYIHVWDSKKLDIKATLKGHKQRVVYMALGPDFRKIVTGAGDETIRFWDVFGYENQKYSFYNNNPEINIREDENFNNKHNKKENILTDFEIR